MAGVYGVVGTRTAATVSPAFACNTSLTSHQMGSPAQGAVEGMVWRGWLCRNAVDVCIP